MSKQYVKIKSNDANSQYKEHSDLMSVLAMTMEDPQTRFCLKYRLQSELPTTSELMTQYLKHLAAEIRKIEIHRADRDDPEKTAGSIYNPPFSCL